MNQLKDAKMHAGDIFWILIDVELLKSYKKFHHKASIVMCKGLQTLRGTQVREG